MRVVFLFQLGFLLLLCGCVTTEQPEVVVNDVDTMLYLDPELRTETLLFPEYLFMEGFELDQHGQIPHSTLIGVDMKNELDLKTVLRRFNQLLVTKGWILHRAEVEKRSFRLMAEMKDETLEIRAVQGTGPTHVFILYQPPIHKLGLSMEEPLER